MRVQENIEDIKSLLFDADHRYRMLHAGFWGSSRVWAVLVWLLAAACKLLARMHVPRLLKVVGRNVRGL